MSAQSLYTLENVNSNTLQFRSNPNILNIELAGAKLNHQIDLVNNYIYWIYRFNNYNNIDNSILNINTNENINNLGFVIVGDTPSTPTSRPDLATDFKKFNLIVETTMEDRHVSHRTFHTNRAAKHIIYGCDYYAPRDEPINQQVERKEKPEFPADTYTIPFNGILYQYCYDGSSNNKKLYNVYGESKNNYMNLTRTPKLSTPGGVLQGNIITFYPGETITIKKFSSTQIGDFGASWGDHGTNLIYTRQNGNNCDIKTTMGTWKDNQYAGNDTEWDNLDIKPYGRAIVSGLTPDINNNLQIVDYSVSVANLNKPTTSEWFLMPNNSNPEKSMDFVINIPTISINLPFIINKNIYNYSDITFNTNNNKDTFIIKPSGVTKFNAKFNNPLTYKIDYHNRRFEPTSMETKNSIKQGYQGNFKDYIEIVETYDIKCVNPIKPQDITVTPLESIVGTQNFAIIYYPIIIPTQITIPSNVTVLTIDSGVLSVPTIFLPSVSNGYELNIKNNCGKSITTNFVRQRITTTYDAGTPRAHTSISFQMKRFTSSNQNIIFTYINDSNGYYWSKTSY